MYWCKAPAWKAHNEGSEAEIILPKLVPRAVHVTQGPSPRALSSDPSIKSAIYPAFQTTAEEKQDIRERQREGYIWGRDND